MTSYDKFLGDVIRDLKAMPMNEAGKYLQEKVRSGLIESIGTSLVYRYKEYYIFDMARVFGEKAAADYQTVSDLGLSAFPRFVESIAPPGESSMLLVTRIPGNTGKHIAECPQYIVVIDRVPAPVKRSVVNDLKKLESHGFVLNPTFRYCVSINDDGNIIIPSFDLIPVEKARTLGILEDVYSRYGLFGEYVPPSA